MNQENKLLKIALGVITAPRHKSTVDRMLVGLKFTASIPEIHVFVEPGTEVKKQDNQVYHHNEKTRGCFGNFDHAYRWLFDNVDADFYLVLSDDMKFKSSWYKTAIEYLSKLEKDNLGYLALYTPSGMGFAFPNNPHHEIITLNREWGKGGWGGLYCIPKESLEKILNHEFYLNHKTNYTQNQQFDECIKQTCYELELDQKYVNPSLFDHVGETSTIGHDFRRMDRGLNFGRNK